MFKKKIARRFFFKTHQQQKKKKATEFILFFSILSRKQTIKPYSCHPIASNPSPAHPRYFAIQ